MKTLSQTPDLSAIRNYYRSSIELRETDDKYGNVMAGVVNDVNTMLDYIEQLRTVIKGYEVRLESKDKMIEALKDLLEVSEPKCEDCSGDLNRDNYETGICSDCQWVMKN